MLENQCKKKKLYGFDNHTFYKFVKIIFKNNNAYNKVKNFWFNKIPDKTSSFGYSYILKTLTYRECKTELYEAKLPPVIRFFHVKDINPSGWIKLVGDYEKVLDKETSYRQKNR